MIRSMCNLILDSQVTAIASGNGVLKAIARQNPASDRIKLNEAAILASRVRNCPRVRSLSVPRAKPRMTVLWIERQKGTQAEKERSAIDW